MSGTVSASAQPPDSAALGGLNGGTVNPISPSIVNSYRINAVAERLASHVQSGNRGDPIEFFNLCLSLSRGIDYALANGEIPGKAQDLPILMKQICHRKNDAFLQAAIMVLMISVKNACKIGWFQTKESEELLTIANEIGKIYSSMGNVSAGPFSCHSATATIMERFYPKMKLGPILASIEAKPGYGASAVDFHITKSTVLQDKIWLLVAQIDNIETSACLISPQQVNFLLNGKGVDRRTNILMDTGPQMPTNVTGMLKFGTNLLQTVGQFNGHYIILVAYMSVTSLPEHLVLLDYVQPAVTSVDSDSDIIEGPSQISLNCPISFTRIKTPVKGRSCKHFQCFDFNNFININSRRPSWRCPHCNQYVCYTDIRLDRNMVEVLKDVGENIVEVIVCADGSWKAVLENDHNVDKMQNKAHNCEKEQTEPQESTCSPSAVPNVFDLTNDDQMEMMDTCETVDRKPFQASVHGQFVAPNSTSFSMNSAGINQNVAAQIEDDFWYGVYIANSGSDTPTVGVPERTIQPDTVSPAFNQEAEGHDNNRAVNSVMHNQFSAPNNLQLQLNYNSLANEYGRSPSIPRHIGRTPVAVQALPVQSPALGPQQNTRTNLNSMLPSSSTVTPHASLSNPTLGPQQNTRTNLNSMLPSSSTITPHASLSNPALGQQQNTRTNLNLLLPSSSTATPHVPLSNPALVPQQNLRTNLTSLLPSSSNATPLVPLSNPATADGSNAILSDTERQQHFSRSPMNLPQVSSVNSSALQHHAVTQSRVPPVNMSAPSQMQRPYSGLFNEFRNPHLQQALNPQALLSMRSSNTQRSHIQQGGSQPGIVQGAGATTNSPRARAMPDAPVARQSQSILNSMPVQNQTSPAVTSFTADDLRGLTGEQRGNVGGTAQSVSRPDGLFNLQSEQNWRPTARMRGSLSGRQYSDDVRQRIIAPTQPVQSSRPQGPQPVRPPSVSPQLDVLIANNRNAHNYSPNK